jgi:DNA-binding response OmpR family regulator
MFGEFGSIINSEVGIPSLSSDSEQGLRICPNHIVVVDDEKSIGKMVKMFVGRILPDVLCLAYLSAESLMNYIETTNCLPMVIVTDKNLGGMTGFDLCREVNRLSVVPEVIMITGDELPEELPKCDGCSKGVCSTKFFAKPFSPRDLVEEIRVKLPII